VDATLDASGRVLVTAHADGSVRVGPVAGGEPHLLLGHGGPVAAVAVSPDGRWIASSSGTEIRLWPMPDVSQPPFHTLPYAALMAKLGSLTNLRVVEDTASPTGYRLDIGPFPGWKDVPTW
jgi:WD40 repeat protein